jgi:replicative DNA helicase
LSERGLPTNLEAEKVLLARLLADSSLHVQAASLTPEDFSFELHRRVIRRYREMLDRGETPDLVAVAKELQRHGENDGTLLSYLIDLDMGVPAVQNVENYVRLVKDASDLRRIIFVGQNLMNRAMLGEENPDEILAAGKGTLLDLAQGRAVSSLETPGAIIAAAGGLSVYLDRRKRTRGLDTGFRRFDAISGGLQPGKLYILGARPRMGKTALVLNIAENVSLKGDHASLIFSLEMDKESLVDRMVCSRARVDTKRFEGGYINAEESPRLTRSAGEIAGSDLLHIDDKATTNMQEIHAKVRKHAVKQPVGLVVIDYLQLMINGSEKYRVGEMSKISRDAKLLAKDCKVPVIGLSQLSRECDTRTDHRPQLSDLRESGSIEQDADLVAFLYRPEVYDPDREDFRNLAELIVAKQRSGPEGTVPLVWMKHIVRFESAAEDYETTEYMDR